MPLHLRAPHPKNMHIRPARLAPTDKKPMIPPPRLTKQKLQPRATLSPPQALTPLPLPPPPRKRADISVLVVNISDHDVDVDDGLSGQAGDGSAADVGDGEEGRGGERRGEEGRGDEGFEMRELGGPEGVVGLDYEGLVSLLGALRKTW